MSSKKNNAMRSHRNYSGMQKTTRFKYDDNEEPTMWEKIVEKIKYVMKNKGGNNV